MPTSAGCVVTRVVDGVLQVLLVHARGASFRRPLFGIPKGLVESGESLEEAAVRETREETGLEVVVQGPLGSVRQRSGKVVWAFWATVAGSALDRIDAGGRCRFPDRENDVCRFYPLAQAAELMIPAQREFLVRLEEARAAGS